MFRNRAWFRTLVRNENYHSIKKSRSRRTKDPKNLMLKPTGSDCGNSNSRKRKIGQPVRELNIDSVRKRRKTREHNVVCDRSNLDRISELPESIIHHIFAFMKCTKDVARTSVLSKKWRNTFDSYSTLDYDERWFRVPKGVGKHNRIKARELQKQKFKNYVNRSLATRLDSVPCIDKFRLCVNSVDNMLRGCTEGWLSAVAKKNVKELDFQVRTDGKKHSFLPDDVFTCASLTSLKLSGFVLSVFSDIRMSNLREVSVKDSVIVGEYVINRIENSCPSLEDLRFVSCSGVFNIVISSLVKLKRVEVHDCDMVSRIEIASPNLESFWYHKNNHRECKIDLKGSGNLKNLTLMDREMTDTALHDFISKCPLLEKLELHKCSNLERLTILSDKLKRLALIRCNRLQEINIDAPNLYTLQYSGCRLPFSSVNVSGLHEAKFSFGPTMRTNKRIVEYQQLFGNFDRSKGFKLIVYSEKTMKIYEEPGEAHLPPNKFCKLELTASMLSVSKTVDNWLRESHGTSLALISPSCDLIKSIRTMIMDREDSPSCCGFYSNKCWRHYIVDVDVEIRTQDNMQEMCYDFKWKSRQETLA